MCLLLNDFHFFGVDIPRKPTLTVYYHLVPNIAIAGELLVVQCYGYPGKDGMVSYSLSVKGTTYHWRTGTVENAAVVGALDASLDWQEGEISAFILNKKKQKLNTPSPPLSLSFSLSLSLSLSRSLSLCLSLSPAHTIVEYLALFLKIIHKASFFIVLKLLLLLLSTYFLAPPPRPPFFICT